jgi:hypothetical protein
VTIRIHYRILNARLAAEAVSGGGVDQAYDGSISFSPRLPVESWFKIQRSWREGVVKTRDQPQPSQLGPRRVPIHTGSRRAASGSRLSRTAYGRPLSLDRPNNSKNGEKIPALIVFGRIHGSNLNQAAVFLKKDAEAAKKAALDAGLLLTEEHRRAAAVLPPPAVLRHCIGDDYRRSLVATQAGGVGSCGGL